MKMLGLYKWIAGSLSDFTRPFQNNEVLYNQAKSFWRHLESSSIVLIIIFIVLGILLAAYYYKPYNEKPGRHYRPINWICFWLLTFALTFIVTLNFEYMAVAPKLQGAFLLEAKIAVGNALYSSLLFLVTSIVWCNFLPTNAYRIFKPNHKI